MSTSKIYITLVLIAFNLVSVHAQSTCTPEQRKELILTAVDKDGGAINGLRVEHLTLKIGNTPATISDVVFHDSTPLDLAIMIDASLSQEKVLPLSKAAARSFVSAVGVSGRAGEDRVAVISFSDKTDYLQALTQDLTAVAQAIDQIEFRPPPGYVGGGVVVSAGPPPKTGPIAGSTSLWDAVRTATQDVFSAPPKDRRRVLLLFSDGTDTSSSSKLNPAIDEANKQMLAVFSIGVVDGAPFSVDEESLKKLSDQTGGIARFPGKKKEKLEAALAEIWRQLRGNYIVGYCGGDTKARAKLQLEIVDPELRKTKPILAYKRY